MSRLNWMREYPLIHRIDAHSDLSHVGCADCGHKRVDSEILNVKNLFEPESYVLVSLPMLARWHTTRRFDAERILRQSGKFDYSEPQFFHLKSVTFHPYLDIRESENLVLYYEFESHSPTVSPPESFASLSAFCNRSATLPCDKTIVCAQISKDYRGVEQISIQKYNGKFSHFLSLIGDLYPFTVKSVAAEFLKPVYFGSDLNRFQLVEHIYIGPLYRKTSIRWFDLLSFTRCEEIDISTIIKYNARFALGKCEMYFASMESYLYLIFLLKNGLSFFYSNPVTTDQSNISLESFWIKKLFLFPLFRGFCQQLMALGFGRRELHPSCLQIYDERLSVTRERLSYMPQNPLTKDPLHLYPVWRELNQLIESFDAGPLSLQQLSRIAIRRAVGGANFATRMKRMSCLMPPILFKYVSNANELMLTSKQLDKLFKKN